MSNSLGDQLVKAGLVNKDQLNKAKKSKHKQQKQKKKQKGAVVNEATESARRVAAEKVARDHELNRQQKEAVERKAVQAQIRQLVEMNRLRRDGLQLSGWYCDQEDLCLGRDPRQAGARTSCHRKVGCRVRGDSVRCGR